MLSSLPLRWQRCLQTCFTLCLCVGALLTQLGWATEALAQSKFQSEIQGEIQSDRPSNQTSAPSTEALFSENCAACHARGGNIIRRGKNLKRRALTRNGYGEVRAIAALITQGKGAMPAYADRLSAEDIDAIAQYVQQKSESGW